MCFKIFICICLYIVTWSGDVRSTVINENVQNSNTKISDGVDAEIDNFTYMAFLAIDYGNQMKYCGGAIISKNYILTAANCLKGGKTVKVRIASTYSNSGGFEYVTNNFDTHPRYNNNTNDYDIGYVKVEEGMVVDGKSSGRIQLPPVSDDARTNEVVTISGWGATEADGTEPNLVLQKGKVKVITRADCRKRLRAISRRVFCAVGDANICKGDLGGPAVGIQRRLNGIAARAPMCGENQPGVYTRIGESIIRTYIRTATGI